jgi:hypothetical protein
MPSNPSALPTLTYPPTAAPTSILSPLTLVHTGAVQTFTVPAGVTNIAAAVYGASGGGGTSNSRYQSIGGWGAMVAANIPVYPGQVLYIYVGGTGGVNTPGFNGGGAASVDPSSKGGGGATDIRTLAGDLSSRILVAGGGGGGSVNCGGEGRGGAGTVGAGGTGCSALYMGITDFGTGATTTSGGAQGAACTSVASAGTLGDGGATCFGGGGGGGGGGYYGGGGAFAGGGGAGSSYSNYTIIASSAAANDGTGFAILSWIVPVSPCTVTFAPIPQLFTVPADVYFITAKLWGAGGADWSNTISGGNGGMISAVIPVVPGELLQIFVGGAGSDAAVTTWESMSFNGGGKRGVLSTNSKGGGGATDIRRAPYTLQNRALVAGGGGSSNGFCLGNTMGGHGGWPSGTNGCIYAANDYGEGGSATAGGSARTYSGFCTAANAGSFGQGGPGCVDGTTNGGAGGGGYYGGGGSYRGGGGGGSSYSNYTILSASTGANHGNGYALLTWSTGRGTEVPSANPTRSPSVARTDAPTAAPSVGNHCPNGTYQSQPGSSTSVCAFCPAGTFSVSGFAKCETCPAGTYSNAWSDMCKPCPAGFYCPEGAATATTCAPGTYSSVGSARCVPCAEGTYSGSGASACDACPAGFYCPKGAAAMAMCPAGTVSFAGAHNCTACPTGEYSYPGSSVCLDCSSA